MKSPAIEKLAAIQSERNRLQSAIQEINSTTDKLRGKLSELASESESSADAIATAKVELSQALAADDPQGAEAARNRLQLAQKSEAKAHARAAEIEALKSAIEGLNEKARPMATRLMEIDRDMVNVTGDRLREYGREFSAEHRAAIEASAKAVSGAMALNMIADRLGLIPNYGPPYMATVSAIGIAGDDPIHVPTDALRNEAAAVLIARLHREGFNRV